MVASLTKKGRKALLAKKIGMTQIFQEDGTWLPVTVLEVGPCTVLQVKTSEVDSYSALQVGFEERRKQPLRPQQGLYRKARVSQKRWVREIPSVDPAEVFRVPLYSEVGGTVDYKALVAGENLLETRVGKTSLVSRAVVGPVGPGGNGSADDTESNEDNNEDTAVPEAGLVLKDSGGRVVKEYALPAGSAIAVSPGDTVADGDLLGYVPVGEEPPEEIKAGMQIGVNLFKETARVDIRGVTKGRGFQGSIKRHGFASGDKSHGGKSVRRPGSTGMCTSPGRTFKGKRMPGQMGAVWRKIRALKVVEIDTDQNLMLIHGAVPGPNGACVLVQESLKKSANQSQDSKKK